MELSQIVDYIILGGALVGALYKLWDFFAAPTSRLKQFMKQRERQRILMAINDYIPQKLEEHDRENLREINEKTSEQFQRLDSTFSQLNQSIETLSIGIKDVLREKIMQIYHKGRENKLIYQYEREALDTYYKDYKALGGNSYIDKYYKRMNKWAVAEDTDAFEDDYAVG